MRETGQCQPQCGYEVLCRPKMRVSARETAGAAMWSMKSQARMAAPASFMAQRFAR